APERQVRHAAKNTGGEGGPTQRGRPEGSEAEERVEREDAGTREGERCGTDAIEERNLDPVRRGEGAVRQVNADRGHDHDREHQRGAAGAEGGRAPRGGRSRLFSHAPPRVVTRRPQVPMRRILRIGPSGALTSPRSIPAK